MPDPRNPLNLDTCIVQDVIARSIRLGKAELIALLRAHADERTRWAKGESKRWAFKQRNEAFDQAKKCRVAARILEEVPQPKKLREIMQASEETIAVTFAAAVLSQEIPPAQAAAIWWRNRDATRG